ncbi:sulfotransferase [Rhodopirellula sp. MGV]|uniref:sulfotransferase n=1 Tax=Rhodopirellula sp. MGV TaxID=2023130 RepID=UPI000B95D393|nr:sulfotransferase [Rhodopirellula sp. MGV]OYP33018.1 hypothetical protein CGZ80_19205 [Rhodopirellula sp. MGV]PNY35320.1 hypothetical protein C2E31_17480 [Rhodopirellula baltica]
MNCPEELFDTVDNLINSQRNDGEKLPSMPGVKQRRTSIDCNQSWGSQLRKRLSMRVLAGRKYLYQRVCKRKSTPLAKLFIFGCQRSGTSMLCDVFHRDLSTEVLYETSRITCDGHDRLRLREVEQVRELLERSPARLVVAKPIVESQNASYWLDQIPGLQAVWMYRRYPDQIRSHVTRFDSQRSNLESIVRQEQDNWRSENIDDEMLDLVRQFYRPEMRRQDAAGLYWYLRNYHLFRTGLHKDPRVHVLCYEELVRSPEDYVSRLYDVLDVPVVGTARLCNFVDTRSIGHGESMELSPAIADLCDDMMAKLQDAFMQGSLGTLR